MIARFKEIASDIGLPRLLIGAFVLLLLITAAVTGLDLAGLITDSLVRAGMNGVLVLAMVPSIASGVGLNFGLPLGIVCGLLGALISMQFNFQGFFGLFVAVAATIPIAVVAGLGYAWLLDKVRGQEMMVGTYVGFSAVAFMCMFWLLIPFNNPELIWPIGGKGLRYTLTLGKFFGKVLNGLWAFKLFGVTVPTGLLLAFLGACLLVHLFFRTKLGLAVTATGDNPKFAEACGINTRKMRAVGVVLSTVIAAIGIVVYAQSYGFLQLYTAPLMMAFPAVAAVLIGGASLRRATVSNVIVGTLLFQTLLTVALPVTSRVIEGDISEVARLIISNGMILYALTRATGGK